MVNTKCSGNNTHLKITALLLRCGYHVSFNGQMNGQLCRWPEGAVSERARQNCRVHTRGYLVSLEFHLVFGVDVDLVAGHGGHGQLVRGLHESSS